MSEDISQYKRILFEMGENIFIKILVKSVTCIELNDFHYLCKTTDFMSFHQISGFVKLSETQKGLEYWIFLSV